MDSESPRSLNKIVAAAMKYDLSDVIDRYVKDYEVPVEVAREHERELKRYLCLCAANPKKRYGMRGPVDEFWHTFLLFTTEYLIFCKKIAGKIIHHKPRTKDEDEDRSLRAYENTLEDYKLAFGEEPPAHLWVPVEAAAPPCSGSCNQCGSGDPGCSGGCSGCSGCGRDCSS